MTFLLFCTKICQIKEVSACQRENLYYEKCKQDKRGRARTRRLRSPRLRWRRQSGAHKKTIEGGPQPALPWPGSQKGGEIGPTRGRIRGSGGKARIASTVLLIRRREHEGWEEERAQRTWPVRRRISGKSDLKNTNTEMIPTEWSCHSAPLSDCEQNDLNWGKKSLKENKGMVYCFFLNRYFKTNHKLTENIFQLFSKIELFVIFWAEETHGDMWSRTGRRKPHLVRNELTDINFPLFDIMPFELIKAGPYSSVITSFKGVSV